MRKSYKLIRLFIIFFRIGALTIGGGMAMLPVIKREAVDKQHWVSEAKLVDIFAVTQSLPGVISINSSMYLGYEVAGLSGLAAASLGVIMPSFLIIAILAFLMNGSGDNVYLSRFFGGVSAAVVPMILISAFNLSKAAVKDGFGVIVAAASLIVTVVWGLDVVIIVLACGAAGYIYYTFRKGGFRP